MGGEARRIDAIIGQYFDQIYACGVRHCIKEFGATLYQVLSTTP